MPIMSKPSAAPRTSLFYITVGSLLTIWPLVWIWQFPPEHPVSKIICYGLLLTGIAFLLIGFLVGRIGRAARHAELPPEEALGTVARTEQTAAARPSPVVPVQTVTPAVGARPPGTPGGPVNT